MKNLISQAHEMAKSKGFWDEKRNTGELLMLVVSELSEGLEALRKDDYADQTVVDALAHDLELDRTDEEFMLKAINWKTAFEQGIKSSFEDEMADVAIRLFDLCGGLNIDLEKHIEMKMKYNSMRGYKHGKKF